MSEMTHIDRREFIRRTALGVGAVAALGPFSLSTADEQMVHPYMLPELQYSYDALEPYIDARTMEIHHSKHHAGYVRKLNAALDGLETEPIEKLLAHIGDLPEGIRQKVTDSGGGHANHSLLWSTMGPGKGGGPSGSLASAINAKYGNFDSFKEQFSAKAATRFGSGWGWLVVDNNQELELYSTANQDSPHMMGDTPVLGIDVWEHAYYLNYQNRRKDYITAWFNLVDWDSVGSNYEAAMG